MITPDQIPPEVVEAALLAWMGSEGTPTDGMRAAIAAALAAWPGVYANGLQKGWKHYTPALILPLPPQENPDAASK